MRRLVVSSVLLSLAVIWGSGCGGGGSSTSSTDTAQTPGQHAAQKWDGGSRHRPKAGRRREQRQGHPQARGQSKLVVPSVIGMHLDAAKAVLADHGLAVDLTSTGRLYNSCSDRVAIGRVSPVSSSEVVAEFPEPGEHARRGRRIDLQTDTYNQSRCLARKSLPPCRVDELSLKAKADYPDTAGGSELGQVTAIVRHTRGSHACRLDAPIEVTVEAPPGVVPSAISGDPATFNLRSALRLRKKLEVTWVWYTPWCGSRDAVGSVSLDGLHATTPMSKYVPTCYHSGHSRLSRPGLLIFRR